MSGLDKIKPLEMKGETRVPRPGKKGKRPAGEDIPWVEYETIPDGWPEDIISIDQVVDFMVIFEEVVERASRFDEGNYILARVKIEDEEYTLRTGSKPVCGAIKHMENLDKIPFRALVERRKGKWPGGYFCLSGPQTADSQEK